MTRKFQSSLPILILLIAAVAIFSTGCKKKPAAATATPAPPAVAKTEPAPEPVKEEPMKPVVEEPIAAPRMGAAEYNKQGLLKTVYFDTNRHEIRPDQRPALEANALALKNAPISSFHVVIEGHCDERNTSEYNMALGDRRANSIKQYLISLGIPASRLRTISYGEERPVDPGHNEEAWAKNRRGEFVLEEG
jgi:peptidoglycan-associated lipoprotein